jgi:hypothetical protein
MVVLVEVLVVPARVVEVVAGIGVPGLEVTVNGLDDVTTGSYPTLLDRLRFSSTRTRIGGFAVRPIDGSTPDAVAP